MAYIIEYAKVSPAVLDMLICREVQTLCNWRDINEDYFEFIVMCEECDRAKVERVLARYM